jgi:coenzyme F420-reducing hydrogenase gamma subunit
MTTTRPRLGVFKFASCDGCQLSLLDCEDQLLAVADRVEIAYFLEATRRPLEGEFDVALVEGSVSTPDQENEIRDIRRRSRFLIMLGACASHGGIQGLRNFGSLNVDNALAIVYASPQYVETLACSRPASAYVAVDL